MPKPERKQINLNKVPPETYEAVEFVKNIHGDKYEGVSSVLYDYSVNQCVEIHQKAKAEVA